jgi:hypothetical protein
MGMGNWLRRLFRAGNSDVSGVQREVTDPLVNQPPVDGIGPSQGDKAMDELEWRLGTDPYPMLAFLGNQVNDRKQWLLACACCRRIPGFLTSDAGRHCLEVVERFADGRATEEELAALEEGEWDMRWYRNWPGSSLDRAITTFHDAAWERLPAGATPEERRQATSRAMAEVADLVRELFGNPFRPARIAPAWLWCNRGRARKLAHAIYSERRFEHMPILADVLVEAGCDNQEVVAHCRWPGLHVRGCWVVDSLLAKR